MARNKMQELIHAKLTEIQEGHDEPVWVSGIQVTQLLKSHNSSSIRMALLLLTDAGRLWRERRKGRGKRGKTGQSSWYAIPTGIRPTEPSPYEPPVKAQNDKVEVP